MDFLQSSFGNKQSQDKLNKYLMYLKKQKDSKLPALQDNQNIDPNLDIMLNRDITSPDYRKVPIEFPQTPSTVKETPKSNALTDRQKFAKTLGISEQTLNSLDANTTDLSKGIDALTAGKDLSAFMNVNAPSKTIKAGTPLTGAQAIAPAGTTATGQPTKSQDIATRTTAPAGTEPPKPQEDEFGNRMAATAVGNILGSLGAGLAGYSPTSVNQMFQGLYGQLMQRQKEKEERDPNSVVSKNYRDMIQPYIPKGINLEGKSAFDLKQTVPYMIAQAEREADRQFKASEGAKDRASMERRYESAYGAREKRLSNEAFKILKKDADQAYDASSAKGILQDVNNAIRTLDKAEKENKNLTYLRAKGAFGIGGDPYGLKDPDLNMLGTLSNSIITKLNKLSGDNVISNDDRRMYTKDFPAVNSGGLREHLTNLKNTIYEQRKLTKDKLDLYTNAVNQQYGTNFNTNDFFNLDIGENEEKAKDNKPNFRR
jgi:hypothetical protein